jgi:hypothetical protein
MFRQEPICNEPRRAGEEVRGVTSANITHPAFGNATSDRRGPFDHQEQLPGLFIPNVTSAAGISVWFTVTSIFTR